MKPFLRINLKFLEHADEGEESELGLTWLDLSFHGLRHTCHRCWDQDCLKVPVVLSLDLD